MDHDPDPGGPKTYGSGSATLANQRCLNTAYFWYYRAGEPGAESEDDEEEENEEEGAESYSDSAETDSVAGGTPTTEEEALAARVEPSADSKPADEIISTAVGEAEAASNIPESNEREKSGGKDCESTSSNTAGSLLPSGSGSSTSVIQERDEGEGEEGLEGDLVEIRDTLREASREARELLREVQDLN
jgi:hypothetical protein